jgi:hypothetical protein
MDDMKSDGFSAINAMAATIGIMCGFSGLEHGFFEMLQGNAVPAGRSINAIGEAFRFWRYGVEPAYTLIPNFLITGIVAIVFSAAVMIVSVFFVRKKYGWIVFTLFSILQYLSGGGAAQFGLAIVIGIMASRIDKPLRLWRKIFPLRARQAFSKIWLICLIAFSAAFFHSIVTAVFGFLYGVRDPVLVQRSLWYMFYSMLALFPISAVSALSRDSLRDMH